MTSGHVSRTLAISLIAAGLFALSYGGIAHAITDTVFQYSKPKVGQYSFGPLAFAPGDNSTANNYQILPEMMSTNSGCFVTGVHLPDGARLTAFTSWVSSDTQSAFDIALWRVNLATGDRTLVAELESDDTSQARVALTRSIEANAIATINNMHFNYGVSVCVEASISRYYSGRISYTYANAGD